MSKTEYLFANEPGATALVIRAESPEEVLRKFPFLTHVPPEHPAYSALERAATCSPVFDVDNPKGALRGLLGEYENVLRRKREGRLY